MISVIVPCYNYGHLIHDTIKSVIAQTYTNWELIVVDDGSTDNTRTVVDEFISMDSRIKYVWQSNSGLASARNKGLQNSKGEYIQFLDADDLIESQKFQYQIELFKNNSETDIVYGSVRYFRNDPYDLNDRLFTYWGENKEWMPGFSGYGRLFLPEVLAIGISHLSSPLFSKKIVDQIGQFDSEINAVADSHFLMRCLIADSFFLYHDTPGSYSLVRWHPSNMSKNLQLMQSEQLKMHKKLIPFLLDFPEAKRQNERVIKSLNYQLQGSWKAKFLSGGRLDFFKPVLRFFRIESVVKRIFYK